VRLLSVDVGPPLFSLYSLQLPSARPPTTHLALSHPLVVTLYRGSSIVACGLPVAPPLPSPSFVVSFQSNRVSFFRNLGGSPPTFKGSVILTTLVQPSTLFLRDMDGDNKTDVVTGSVAGASIMFLKNVGGVPPTFTASIVALQGASALWAEDMVSEWQSKGIVEKTPPPRRCWYEV
jgi:hypothetical protein